MNAKLQNSSKPKYVSKAERAAIAAKEAEANVADGSASAPEPSDSIDNDANSETK